MNKGKHLNKAPAALAILPVAIKKLLEALVYSSVFISCCAFALTLETYWLAGLSSSMPMAVFVFLATLFTYNLSSVQSIIRRPNQQRNRQSESWVLRHKQSMAVLGVLSITSAIAVYFVFELQINLWFILHLAVISIGYTVPVLYKKKRIRALRSVPLLKVFLIAYVWAMVTGLLPLLDAGLAAGQPETWLLFARRFLFILALALLFDVRDYHYDRQMKTLTFPGLIGVQNTKILSLGLLVVYVALLFATEESALLLALIASAVVATAVIIFASEHKPRLYYLLLVDGAMLVHAGFVYLATR